jgi:hypothetical protein
MTDDLRGYDNGSPFGGAPTWLRAAQAALIGVGAGLALHALVSFVVVHGEGQGTKPPAPTQCKKANPARDAAAPPASTPRISRPV